MGSPRSRPRTKSLVVAAFLLALLALFVSPTLADEIFVPPAVDAAGASAGQNFPVMTGTTTHFTFGIPNDMTDFVAAKVVLIPAANGFVTYSMTLSLAQDTELNYAHFFSQGSTATPVTLGLITEVDVSAIFTT